MKQFTLEIDDASYAFEPEMWDKLFNVLQLVMNRMAVGHHKYHVDRNLPLMECDTLSVEFIRQRLAMYSTPNHEEVCNCDAYSWKDRKHRRTCFTVMHKTRINSHNLENLLDVVNGCLVEFIRPSYKNAYFRAQSSSESPGLVYKE